MTSTIILMRFKAEANKRSPVNFIFLSYLVLLLGTCLHQGR